MMKLMKRMLVIILACSIFVGGVSNYEMIKAKNNIEGEMLIKSLVTSIKNQDWDTYKMLMSDDQKEFYEDYFSDEKNTDGIKQILNIDLDDIIELTKDEVSDELLYDEYPSLKKATSLESFLISVNCKVDKENAFFYNGINYFLIVLVQEADGEYKIAQFNRPSYQLLEKIVGKEIKDTDKGKKIALEVVKYAEKATNKAVNAISNEYMVDTSFCIFFPEYGAGDKGEAGKKVLEDCCRMEVNI